MDSPTHNKEVRKGFGTLYLHKISCPQKIFEKSMGLMHEEFDRQQRMGIDNFGFWIWGAQVFVPAMYLKNLTIVSVKKMGISDFCQKYQEGMNKRYRYMGTMKPREEPKQSA